MQQMRDSHWPYRSIAGLALVIASSLQIAAPTHAQVLEATLETEVSSNRSSGQAQQRIGQLADRADSLVTQYRAVVSESDALKIYHQQLARLIESQRSEMASIDQQLGSLEQTNRGIVPLMIQMIDTLERIIESDTPFMLTQRRKIVADLRSDIYRADVTTSEKYRRVLEAYQQEVDFGRNAATYQGALPGSERTVTFLKVGRVLLFYQSPDQQEVGWWNPTSRSFETLAAEHQSSVRSAIRIASNQAAPNLVVLPIPVPTSVSTLTPKAEP